MLKNQEDELELVFPTKEYKTQIEEYLQEFLDNGETDIAGDGGLDIIKDVDKWLESVKNDLSEDTVEKDRVPSTVYLTIRKSDNKIVGNIQIRHYLNDNLYNDGGHIGDSVRPFERRKGYATEQIRLALIKCKELGIDHVLMDCDKTNVGSAMAIQNNGGILEKEVEANNKIKQRYWISLKKRYADKSVRNKAKDTDFKIVSTSDEYFKGDICYLYLDVVVTPTGELILLDEDELQVAYDRMEITKEEYDNAYKEAENLMERLKGKKDELLKYTDKYLKNLMEV